MRETIHPVSPGSTESEVVVTSAHALQVSNEVRLELGREGYVMTAQEAARVLHSVWSILSDSRPTVEALAAAMRAVAVAAFKKAPDRA